MAAKVPIRTVFDGEGNATGLAEFQSGEFIDYAYGGTGVATLGSAGQVLKVNSGGTALEYGNVEAIVNIDGATDLTGVTLATTDQLLASDGGSEGRITLAQIDTLFTSTSQTLSNKTINSASNTITITEANISDLQSYILAGSTDTLTNKTINASNNTITNIGDSELSSGINATKLADGSVSNTEFQYLNGVTSAIQTQLDSKASTNLAIAQAIALG